MTDELKMTIRMQIPSGDGPGEEAELELISTQELHVLLEGDAERRSDLEKVARDKDGVLARNVDNDEFQILDQTEVADALARAEDRRPLDVTSTELAELSEDGEPELGLVSTMMLKSMLDPAGNPELAPADAAIGDKKSSGDDDEVVDFRNANFDPYNRG